ncbi:DUF2270 domain-containing protein [Aliifodinibius sp. S!AR15-10]|uniref:DUF2270 domain-containing protein n=1 Tax=Aliifodinibius sp. S!AR15-10 TaxID=2950437 RepID=UPI0028664F41|nr:DUF2270 domain-containing protein [Aliifodinibius sp. S!AR15-10]MDR8392389.1 DUF2270 domain-containing protein [Aliifodinibius sp. S!AR15-10]
MSGQHDKTVESLKNEFEPESDERREVAGFAATESGTFLQLMAQYYRSEVGRSMKWRNRLDRATNWVVVLTASLLTWTFSSHSRPHYLILVGIVMIFIFLVIEARRYQIYDVWRSRVRLLEENIFANALHPIGTEQKPWRRLLSEDLRNPRIKMSLFESLVRRLQRIYFSLLTILLTAWVLRITVFAESGTSFFENAAIGNVPGVVVIIFVGAIYGTVLILLLIPQKRKAKGAIGKYKDQSDEWK